jgi:choline-sulfatase
MYSRLGKGAVEKPNILIFMSDQHRSDFMNLDRCGYVQTPNMANLANEGVTFDNAYTPYPLCIPARHAFLTGLMPQTSGSVTNNDAIPEEQATFAHAMTASGYETVLIGRMHFIGDNQHHGFCHRPVGDITPVYPGCLCQKERGIYEKTLQEWHCLDIIGGGNSPVLEYDRDVVRTAVDWLSRDHEKPQCIVVGTYGPHFTYVAPPKWYEYYKEHVTIEDILQDDSSLGVIYEALRKRRGYGTGSINEQTIINARSAYLGMISHIDELLGEVKAAWDKYIRRCGGSGVFIYTSDHGDMNGDKHIYGKQVLFDGATRIPLIVSGEGLMKGTNIKTPASLIDIPATLSELTETEALPEYDGNSLMPALKNGTENPDKHVISEIIGPVEVTDTASIMVRRGKYKLISFDSAPKDNMLFDLESDSNELQNIIQAKPDELTELQRIRDDYWQPRKMREIATLKTKHLDLLSRWGQIVRPDDRGYQWRVPECATEPPVVT